MNKKNIMELIKPYEASHAVDEFYVNGWHVWPLLRMIACMGYLTEGNKKLLRFSWLRNSAAFKILKWFNRQRITLFYDIKHADQYDAHRDAVILTLSERRVNLDGSLYNIYSDPLVELLNQEGLSTLVWETGSELSPRFSKSAWISRRMSEECNRLSKFSVPGDEPDWFLDYQNFARDIRGKNISWNEIKLLIDEVTNQSTIFERWLRKTDARYLFVVCWYDPFIMAAIMAARRCGIKIIELQHGAEGELHYAYSNWLKVPQSGYEVAPDVFWCWGNNSIAEKKRFSPAFVRKAMTVAGGNLWLNRWRQKKLHSEILSSGVKPDNENRVILVSLQEEVPSLLLEAIAVSPHSWLWQIRYHPSWPIEKKIQYENVFKNINHPGIELVKSNNSLLYELLCESDVHVTEFSTCALEAMAFGIPSVIINEVGVITYDEFISQGLMSSADNASNLIKEIEQAKQIENDNHTVKSMFACRADAIEALKLITQEDVL